MDASSVFGAGQQGLLAMPDEPLADSSAVPTLVVAQATARHVKVALSGLGGDEERTVGGDRPAVVGTGPLTYGELWARCRRLAGALAGLGLQRGDRVAVAAANSRAYLELYQTVPGAGYVLVPLNVRHTQAELAYALNDSATAAIFTDLDPEPFAGVVKQVITLPGQYEELLTGAAEQDPPDDITEGDLAGLFYTGGTTGAAKGVMLTHRNLLANAFHFMACWPFTPETRWLVAAPMFHAAGTIGVFTLLRKRALVTDALSHATLPGLAFAFLLAVAIGVEGRSMAVLLSGAVVSGALAGGAARRERERPGRAVRLARADRAVVAGAEGRARA